MEKVCFGIKMGLDLNKNNYVQTSKGCKILGQSRSRENEGIRI